MDYIWGNHRRYNAYPDYIRKIFNGRVQKLTIDAGFTCPNRDGTKSTGGCTFCVNEAFNPSYCNPSKSIQQQLSEGIEFHERRYRRAKKYLAYFQAYTNTYGSTATLEKYYLEALQVDGVIGLVIGTRPDCVTDETLDLLQKISRDYYVIVEYGVESVYNRTLNRINRGHSFEHSVETINKTVQKDLQTGIHLIFGLPGESMEEMLQSAGIISRLPVTSVKFHQLQLIKGTLIAEEYNKNPHDFLQFTLDGYLSFLADYIEQLNPRIVIERIAGEVPPRYAVTRPWGPRYDQILKKFENLLEKRNTFQGKFFK